LFFQQFIDLNTRELPEFNPELKYQCLIIGDEFTAPGKMQVLSKGIGYLAGYGLRLMPIIQSPAQIVEVYGKEAAQTFTTNHALQIVFPPKASELQTAKDISEWLGYQTVKGTSHSKGKSLFSKREKSENISDQRRALFLPQEITGLGKEFELVVLEDCRPILAKKIRYYSDPVFVDRLKSVSPSLKALGRKLPTEMQLKAAVKAGELAAAVPKIDIDAHHTRVGNIPITVHMPLSGPNGRTEIAIVERPVTARDMPNLDKLALADFVVDFSAVEQIDIDSLDVEAMQAYADSRCIEAGIEV
jgi:type IV secretion system protein VirD4